MKTLKSFSLKLFAILMLFTFIACSGDDDSAPQPSPADNKIIPELKKYKWTYNGYDPEYEERMIYTIYFINDNMGVTKFYNKSPSMGTIEESTTFTYRVDKNNIIIKYDKGSTFDYLWIGDGTFIDPDYNEVYKRSEYTSEDYKYVKDYDPVEIQKKEEKREVIKKNFSVKVTTEIIEGPRWTHDIYTYKFESTLEKVYPTSNINYYICVGDGCSDCSTGERNYLFSSNNKYVISGVSPSHIGKYAEASFYLETIKRLNEKIKTGQTLTEGEKRQLKELDDIVFNLYCPSFISYPCIEIDGELYEFEELDIIN